MSIIPHRVCVVARYRIWVMAAACFALFLATSPVAKALVLDWSSRAWDNTSMNQSGAVANSFDVSPIPDGVDDITVSLTPASNVWDVDPNSGTQTPAVTTTMNGGVLGQKSLDLAADLHTNSRLTVHLSFTGAQPGAGNVSFTIFDIDLSADRDVIDNIYAVALDGTIVTPTITNLGSTVSLTGLGIAQTLTGLVPAPNDTGLGNATISFGSTQITDVFFRFGNSSGPPRYQDIGLGNISFTPVPEINPAATSVMSCLLAVGLTVFVQRRARLKARRLQAAKA